MADIKLDPAELALYDEVGTRGDYFREAVRDKAAQEVNVTGQRSEITSEGGRMVDVVMAPATDTTTDPANVSVPVVAVDTVVPPADLTSVVGKAPQAEPGEPWAELPKGDELKSPPA